NLLSGTYNLTDRILNPDVLFLGTNNNRFELINAYPWMDFTAKYPGTNWVVTHPRDENQINVLSEPDWHERHAKDFRILNNANLNYKFPKFFELDYKYGIENWNSEFSDLYKNQEEAPQVAEAFWGTSPKGSLRIDNVRTSYQNSLATLYFRTDLQKDFGSKLPIRTTAQLSYDWRKSKYNSTYAQGLELPQYPPSNISSAAQKVSGDYNYEYVTFGYLANLTFDYGSLFGFTAGFRSDYNSDFGDQKKAFTFPRGTAYLRLSDLFKSTIFSDLKIRAAYGEAGIPPYQFGGYYLRQTTLGSIQLGSGTGLYLPQIAGNDSLVVQKVKEKELGLDMTLKPFTGQWLNRITLSTTYWHKRNEDIIQNRSGAPSTGVQSTPYNLIDLEIRGLDASLDMDVFGAKNFTWQTGFRFGTFKSKVLSVADDKDFVNGVFVVKKGESVGNFYAVTALTSIDQTRPDKTRYIDPADAGDYEIVNGMVVDKNTKRVVLTDPNDQSLVGNAYPKFTMSWNNSLVYRGLNLTFQWDWSHGNSVYNLTRQWMYRDRLH
ncbi:MAG TPA: TonB-dependent receptor, partial [Flavisolibacter sp.]|nr:TonB-dependent receptor [Flavisolibacter sp.]